MFRRLSEFVTRFWPGVLIFWLALFVVAEITMPDWATVSTDGELNHLPSDAPTRVGGQLYADAFPNDITNSSIVVVLSRKDQRITQEDERFIVGRLVPGMKQVADEYGGLIRGQEMLDWIYEKLVEAPSEELGLDSKAKQATYLFDGGEPADTETPKQVDTSNSSEASEPTKKVPTEPHSLPENISGETLTLTPTSTAGNAKQAEQQSFEADSAIRDVAPTLPQVVSIASVGDPLLGPMLRSADGRSTLVAMNLTSSFLETQNKVVVNRVEDLIQQFQREQLVPEGLQISLTGSTMIGADTIRAVTDSTRAVRKWATWIVVALLLLVLRAPLLALLPLVTLGVSVELAIALLSWCAYYEVLEVFDGLKLYISIIVYGAGVDYSLFMVSRHREAITDGNTVKDAARIAITSAGVAVAASAGTEIVGIGLLGFAEFGKFQQAGVGVAIGLCILLIASLTFTPALLCAAGKRAFWPYVPKSGVGLQPAGSNDGTRHNEQQDRRAASLRHDCDANGVLLAEDRMSRIWRRIGVYQQKASGRVWLGTFVVLLPITLFGLFNINNLTYDLTSSLPDDSLSLRGIRTLSECFSKGATGPITVLVRDDEFDFNSPAGVRTIAALTERLNMRRSRLQISSVRSVADPLGTSERAEQVIRMLASIVPKIPFLQDGELVVADARGLDGTEAILQQAIREFAYRHFVSHTGRHANHVTWLTLTPTLDPYASDSIHRLDDIEATIGEVMPAELEGAEFYLLGATASLRDVRDVARRDFLRIALLVPAGVLIVLMIMLRKIIIPIYLMFTVLLSFLVTIGATVALFWLLDPQNFVGLQWTVPVLLFVLLVAVGEDYSVLLVARTDEEQEKHGEVKGITEALVRTGGLISGAGLIMAGTFSALSVGGTLRSMQQLGFALTFGMLLDTFVVRPLLVPSFQHLLLRWRGVRQEEEPRETATNLEAPLVEEDGHSTSSSVPPIEAAAVAGMNSDYGTLIACSCCGLIQRGIDKQASRLACALCETKLPDYATGPSNTLSAALAIAGLILYLPAVLLPFLQVERLGHVQESSLLGGTISLLAEGEWFAGMIVLAFSVVLPPLKLLTIIALAAVPARLSARRRAKLYRAVEKIGRWGMLDVLLVAVLIAYVKLGDVAEFHSGLGLVVFGAFVLLSLLSSYLFDHRQLWGDQPATELAFTHSDGGNVAGDIVGSISDETPDTSDRVYSSRVRNYPQPTSAAEESNLQTAKRPMSTRSNTETTTRAISTLPSARPYVRSRSWLWLIPLSAIALVIAIVYQAWMERGTPILLTFSSGHGLKAGDEVRYLGTVVGRVDKIELGASLKRVHTHVRLNPSAASLARDGSQFWIVRPQLGLSRISGLDTFIGANYIEVLPGADDAKPQNRFIGLANEPVVDTFEPGGVQITLQADDASSVVPGSPISYRDIRIGGIYEVELASDGSSVEFGGYVRPDYKHLIRGDAKFWKFDGLKVEVGIGGVTVDVGPVETLLIPGVAMAIPSPPGDVVENGHRFLLADEAEENWLSWKPYLGSGSIPDELPSPIQAILQWDYTGLLGFTYQDDRPGVLLADREALIGPRDMFRVPESAHQGTAQLILPGRSVALSRELEPLGVDIVRLSLDTPVSRSTIDYREAKSPEDVLIVAGNGESPIFISSSRLTFVAETWRVEGNQQLDAEWHGAPVVSVSDGAVVGLLMLSDEEPWVGLFRDLTNEARIGSR